MSPQADKVSVSQNGMRTSSGTWVWPCGTQEPHWKCAEESGL